MKKTAVLFWVLSVTGCSAAADEYYVIDHFYIGEDGDAFRTAFEQLTVDTYHWYCTVEGEDGVYLLHTDDYSGELLDQWRTYEVYAHVPENGFWYVTASVNYLTDRGLELSDEEKQMVQDGVRLYLLPDSLSETEAETMRLFLQEDALYGLDGGSLIDTVFSRERQTAFRTYRFDGTIESMSEGEIRDPVIYVCTGANMKYFESESLIATGRNDSYIKLTAEAYERFAKDGLPEELKEREVTFLPLHKVRN